MEHLGESGSSEIHPDSPILYLPIHVSFICGHSQFFPKSFQQQQKVAPPLLTSCGRHSHAVFYYIFCCLKAEALLNGKCRVVRRDGKSGLAANTLFGEMHTLGRFSYQFLSATPSSGSCTTKGFLRGQGSLSPHLTSKVDSRARTKQDNCRIYL